jgi:hypothetical protein
MKSEAKGGDKRIRYYRKDEKVTQFEKFVKEEK